MKNFVLKDELRHKAYSFPKTLLRYHLDEMPEKDDGLYVNDSAVPYQMEKEGGGYVLKTLSDLPTGAERVFTWKKGRQVFASIVQDGLQNEFFSVKSERQGGFRILHKDGAEFIYSVRSNRSLLHMEERLSGGEVEGTLTQTFRFDGGAIYELTVKVKRDLDYLEIYEKMNDFAENEAKLHISWNSFAPNTRYSFDRGEEKIGAYLHEDGEFPFVLNPFMPWVSIYDQRYVAYIDKEFWSGFLFHDLENYDDGQYAIWGSRYNLAFRMYESEIVAPIENGKRAFMHVLCNDKAPESLNTHYLKYYSYVSLDKVKDWTLSWEDEQSEYPKYYRLQERSLKMDHPNGWKVKRTENPTPADFFKLLDDEKEPFSSVERTGPVSCRSFMTAWAPFFDLTASRMTNEEFRRARAALAFVCYVWSQENYFPTRNMLAGHPNFLTDMIAPVGIFAALLGKKHPMCKKWLSYYEISQARNLKYHIRPAVEKWKAKGGRWTEAVGCYMFGMLHASVDVSMVIYRLYGGEMPLLYPHFKGLLSFLVDAQASPLDGGRRYYLPQGAHSGNREFGGSFGLGYFYTLVQLADACKYYEPLLAEYLLYNYRDSEDFQKVLYDTDDLVGDSYARFAVNNGGTSPDLSSTKYTGYGFMLRHSVNTPEEASVFLGQIDKGPNYRWGRAGQGGCGQIFYHANGKKYSDHGSEAVGDENRGDVEACTNFGVLLGHEYKCVGRNDLTEELIDFNFVQYARVNAGNHSAPYYKYRSVFMVGNEYITVYDAVADKKQVGRFTWSYPKDSEPYIRNLRPNVEGRRVSVGNSLDRAMDFEVPPSDNDMKAYDGSGDFLTLVTHLKNVEAVATDYGSEVRVNDRKDYIFNDDAYSFVEEENVAFNGCVGYATEKGGVSQIAIIKGNYIRLKKTALSIPKNGKYAMSLIGGHYGKAYFEKAGEVKVYVPKEKGRIWINGREKAFVYDNGAYIFTMPKGENRWNIGVYPSLGKATVKKCIVRNDGFTLGWKTLGKRVRYEIEISKDLEKTWERVASTNDTACLIKGLPEGKCHVRVRGVREDEVGEYSHPYPVYVSNEKPHCPEGLRVVANGENYLATWGQVLGVEKYRLYETKTNTLVYEGEKRECLVGEGTYAVSCINGNGESTRSLVRSTADEVARWDNHPEKGFVRDTRSYEYGYAGFDYLENPYKPILKY